MVEGIMVFGENNRTYCGRVTSLNETPTGITVTYYYDYDDGRWTGTFVAGWTKGRYVGKWKEKGPKKKDWGTAKMRRSVTEDRTILSGTWRADTEWWTFDFPRNGTGSTRSRRGGT